MRCVAVFWCTLAVALAGGCGGAVDNASGGTSGQGGAGAAGGPCTDTLDAVASGHGFACPNDYVSAERWPISCSYGHGYLGSCNGFLALVVSPGTWVKECYYDPVSRALVGARYSDDVPDYCNRTSRTIAAGSYPSACPTYGLTDLGECAPATGGSGSGTGGMPAIGGSGSGTGGTGATSASGGTTATGGQTGCWPTEPCAAGLCVGASCGLTWTCVVDGYGCTDDLADYCGCDDVSFQDSSTCPKRPYAYRGACGQGTNCDQRDVVCDRMPPACGQGQVPRVAGNCYDGTCVPIDQCPCTVPDECPDRNQYTCRMDERRCAYYTT
jgi:hypothetical protein